MGGELRAVVGAQIGRRPALDEKSGEAGQDIVGPQAAGDDDREAFARVLIDDAEQPQRPCPKSGRPDRRCLAFSR